MKIFKFITLALFIFISVSGSAFAQSNSLSITEAQVGLAGVCKPNLWFPVSVTVENTGADFDARIQITYKDQFGGRFVYFTDAALPSASRKRFTFYAHASDTVSAFTAQVLDGSKLRVEKKLNISCDETPFFIGVWADDPAPYNLLNGVQTLTQKTRVEFLSAQDLPESPQGWQALDALVISNVDTSKLSAAQKTALQIWLAGGGKLLAVGGAQWQLSVAGLDEVLPLEVSATRAISDLGELSAFVDEVSPLEGGVTLAAGRLRENGVVLASAESTPLLIQNQLGAGYVYFLAADPAMLPLRGWTGMNKIYQRIFGFSPVRSAVSLPLSYNSSASNAISALTELSLPSIWYICGWLTLYILMVGPFNFFVLRWLKRPELSWLTIPALAILFSGAAYIFGFAYRGGMPVVHRLTLLRAWDGAPAASSSAFVGVYSPQRTTYGIESKEDFLLAPASGQNLESGDAWLSRQMAGGVQLPGARFDIGGMSVFGAEGVGAPLGIRHDLRLELSNLSAPPHLRGTLTNGNTALAGAFLALPGAWVALGDLAPHQSVQVDESLSVSSAALDIYSAFNAVGLNAYPTSDDKDLQRRSYFLQSVTRAWERGSFGDSGFYLMGWTEDAKFSAPVDVAQQDSRKINETLYAHQLQPKTVAPADFFIVPSSLYGWQSSGGELYRGQALTDEENEVIFQPNIPFTIQRVTLLSFDIQANQQPYSPSSSIYNLLKIYAWNYAAQAWEDISANLQSLPNPADYVGAGGELRLKFQIIANAYIQLEAIDFKVGGVQ